MANAAKRTPYRFRGAGSDSSDQVRRAVLDVLRPALVKVWTLASRRMLLAENSELIAELEAGGRRRGIGVLLRSPALQRVELDAEDDRDWALVLRLISTTKMLTGQGRGERVLFTATQSGMTLSFTDEEYTELRTTLASREIDPDLVARERVLEMPTTLGWRIGFTGVGLLIAAATLTFAHLSVGLVVLMALYLLLFVFGLARGIRLWLMDRRST